MKSIEFRRPEMEDRKLLDGYFKRYPSRSCERTFINVYLWSRHYKVKYAVIENTLVFKNEDHEIAFTYPIGESEDIKNALKFLMEYCEKENKVFELYCVTEEQFEQLKEWYPGEFQITYDRDIADYVYESEKLITLSGKKLHGKRNHINKFKSEHENWKYETMTEDNVEECFQMALQWRKESGCDADVEKNAEMCVALNSLRLFKELEMTGGILRVDGKVVAFTMGEPVNDDTFVVHIEKAFSEIQGAYPMINQQFVEHECARYKYINREDDAGVEGLRKAKLSYRPAFLIGKGRVKR